MHTDLENFWQRAEERFLNREEIRDFRDILDTLRLRLAVYETLRDEESTLFQVLVERLESGFPDENPKLLERALKHWIAVTRYCAMAMLLNNPEYLRHRLLEWLTDIVQVYHLEKPLRCLDEAYQDGVNALLSPAGTSLLQPFLEQTRTNLFGKPTPAGAIL
jgi:hypothetical protein